MTRDDHAFFVHHVGDRVRYSEERGLLRDSLVQDSERLDRSRIGVGQKRKDNPLPVTKMFQNCDRIVTNGCKPQTTLAKALTIFIQLDQLTLAERSPVG